MINPGQVNLGDVTIKSLYTCLLGDAVGDPVYLTGPNTCASADAGIPATMPVLGIISQKPIATECWIVTQGAIEKAAWGLTPGDTYWVAAGGGITNVAPTASGQAVQEIGYAKNATTLFVTLDRDYWNVN